jgi:hypothetical protein
MGEQGKQVRALDLRELREALRKSCLNSIWPFKLSKPLMFLADEEWVSRYFKPRGWDPR